MTSLVAQKRRRFLLQRTLALLLAAALLAVPAASAKTVSVEVPWEKARTIIAEGDFRPKIRVELQSSERLKGKLAGTTDTGLRLKSRGTETSIAREEIRTIRLRPRKTARTKNRWLGLLAGIPAGYGTGILVAKTTICGGNLGECGVTAGYTVIIATLIAVSYGFYKLGARADRGTVLIVLDESAPDAPPPASQAERPSSAKEERP